MITIVDYGVGNIASLLNIFEHIGHDAVASGEPSDIVNAEKLVLPGVGAFDRAMQRLNDHDLIEPIRMAALTRRVPVLGICLGMQLLSKGSEEGQLPGLSLISSRVVRIPGNFGVKVPHMGWATITHGENSVLFKNRERSQRFYFVHSYHMVCDDASDVAGTVTYGRELCVAVSHENIHGVQFHPEKSHRYGMNLLDNFARLGQ